MKIEHDYFNFYLYRLSTYESNRCNENCNEIQTLEHLLLMCRHFSNEQKDMEKKHENFFDNKYVI